MLKKNQKGFIIILQLIFFILLCYKGYDRIVYAGIWAEDGKVFLKQAFEQGWVSLFNSYAGYFHTLPRLIILISVWFPVAVIPKVIVVFNYLFFIIIITYLLKKDYQWIFRKRFYAVTAVLLLFLSSGQATMLGNVTNLHWYLLLWLGILGLKDCQKHYTVTDFVIAFLCISSEGAALIFLPLFGIRLWLKSKMKLDEVRRHMIGEGIMVFLIIAFAVINYMVRIKASDPAIGLEQLKIVYLHLISFVFVHPFVGDHATILLQKHSLVLLLLGILIGGYMVYAWTKNWKKEHLLLLTLLLCGLGLPVLISMARTSNAELLLSFFNYNSHAWFRFRYSFFIPAIASILWMFILQFKGRFRIYSTILLAVILFSQLFLNAYRFNVKAYGRNGDWEKKSSRLARSISTGCPKQVKVKIYPANWEVTIHSPIKKKCKPRKRKNKPNHSG